MSENVSANASGKKLVKLEYGATWVRFTPEVNCHFWRYLAASEKYEPVISSDPDYLIYSDFGNSEDPSFLANNNLVKIYFTGENLAPNFNECDYAIGNDYLDFGDRFLRMPTYLDPGYASRYNLMLKKHELYVSEDPAQREGFCSFVYSNTKAAALQRERLFKALSDYKRVESGGRMRNNVGFYVEDKLAFERGCKFSIACENSLHPGYVTEKIVDAFAAGCIPIYWGDPTIASQFNPEAFIDVGKLGIQAALELVKQMDQDDELYRRMLAQPAIINPEAKRECYMERFAAFADNIFSQDLKAARRFPRSGRNLLSTNARLSKLQQEQLKQRLARLLGKLRAKR